MPPTHRTKAPGCAHLRPAPVGPGLHSSAVEKVEVGHLIGVGIRRHLRRQSDVPP